MKKNLCILIFFFSMLPFFSNSKNGDYTIVIKNYETRDTVELSSPKKEIIKLYIEELDSKKEIQILKMPIDYLIFVKYQEVTFKYIFSGDYLVNDDNYAIIIDGKFKELIESLWTYPKN